MFECRKCHRTDSNIWFKNNKKEHLCYDCFMKESPIVDEGWRIIKETLDRNTEWVDLEEIDKREKGKRPHKV